MKRFIYKFICPFPVQAPINPRTCKTDAGTLVSEVHFLQTHSEKAIIVTCKTNR